MRQQLPDTAARECSPSLPSGRDHTNLHRMAPAAVEPALHQEGLTTRYLERFGAIKASS